MCAKQRSRNCKARVITDADETFFVCRNQQHNHGPDLSLNREWTIPPPGSDYKVDKVTVVVVVNYMPPFTMHAISNTQQQLSTSTLFSMQFKSGSFVGIVKTTNKLRISWGDFQFESFLCEWENDFEIKFIADFNLDFSIYSHSKVKFEILCCWHFFFVTGWHFLLQFVVVVVDVESIDSTTNSNIFFILQTKKAQLYWRINRSNWLRDNVERNCLLSTDTQWQRIIPIKVPLIGIAVIGRSTMVNVEHVHVQQKIQMDCTQLQSPNVIIIHRLDSHGQQWQTTTQL